MNIQEKIPEIEVVNTLCGKYGFAWGHHVYLTREEAITRRTMFIQDYEKKYEKIKELLDKYHVPEEDIEKITNIVVNKLF